MRILFVVALSLVTPLTIASTLTKVDVSQLPGDKFELRMSFDETPPEPKGYTIEKPARIVLDFADVDSSVKDRRIPLAVPNGQSAMVLTSDGRTRLIINLDNLTPYSSRVDGDGYIVEIGSAGADAADEAKVAISNQIETSSSAGHPEINNIDFRRGELGEGRIVLKLSNTKVSANLVETGSGVRLTFKNAWIDQSLRRRLDVLDFATPVSVISSNQEGDNVIFNIAASGDFDYLAYQTDNEYVVSVKPLTEREKAEKKKEFSYTGNKLSLDFQDIEVRAVLQIIADFTNLNLVASDTVNGRITLRLQSVPWDQALDLVLKTKGLDKRLSGNVMMVAPAAEIAERERREIETKKQLEELAPLRTEYIRVRYANAKDMFSLFAGGGKGKGGGGGGGGQASLTTQSVLSERGSGTVDERTNSIIITDTSERIEAFKRLVDQIDIPIRQVMIEARIVVANNNFQRELGIRWGGMSFYRDNNATVDIVGSQEALDTANGNGDSPSQFFDNLATGQDATIDLTANDMVDLATTGTPAGSAAVGILTDNAYLDLELTALENTGYAEIVSQPKVITSDKQTASIRSGKEIAYQEASASGATSTSFKEAVLLLEVTPQITPDNRIIMDLSVSKDALSAVVNGVPTIDVTRLDTKVLVNNGQTVVLGGVFSVDTAKSENKVPVLGDIPFLGRLFKRTLTRTDKSELLIFITPRLMAESLDK
ncbi:MAG: type IV pilus secretin PilQ [Cellvibrio sp.]|nr:type IV pilus secretin PilQ [Cellvibrio sp.]